ncbi:hypothetical protein [Sphingomonas suaedae]|uniref:hypothetical protein n=1 Tax=Sphingomonas suaedae TaxID=2599297 RepID=UPI001645C905|nr:hypothetical protein [Sphingomonas suaedae]
MRQSDYEYYARRERAERMHAERARDSGARHAHIAMAEVYAERLKAMAPPAGATPA